MGNPDLPLRPSPGYGIAKALAGHPIKNYTKQAADGQEETLYPLSCFNSGKIKSGVRSRYILGFRKRPNFNIQA